MAERADTRQTTFSISAIRSQTPPSMVDSAAAPSLKPVRRGLALLQTNWSEAALVPFEVSASPLAYAFMAPF